MSDESYLRQRVDYLEGQVFGAQVFLNILLEAVGGSYTFSEAQMVRTGDVLFRQENADGSVTLAMRKEEVN